MQAAGCVSLGQQGLWDGWRPEVGRMSLGKRVSVCTAASLSCLRLQARFVWVLSEEREESRMNRHSVGKELIIKQKDKTIFE